METTQNILFEFEENWTFEIYKDANYVFMNKVKKVLPKLYVLATICTLICLSGTVYLLLKNNTINIVSLLGTLCCACILFLYLPASIRRKIKDGWKAAPDPAGFDEKITFYNTYFEKSSPVGINRYEYSRFSAVVARSNYIFLIIGGNSILMLRADKCPDGLVNFLREKIG